MQTNVSHINRDQWIVRICLGLLALSLISILLVYWLQFRLAAYHPLGYTPELPVQEKSAIMEKTTRLRDLWRTWVLAHRVELRQMLEAKGNGYAEADRVWRSLPSMPKFDGAGFTGRDLSAPPALFTWTREPDPAQMPASIKSDTTTQERLEKSNKFLENQRHSYAARFHDLAITHSVTPGREWITLWASGRITRTTLPEFYTKGSSPTDQYNDEEVAPPYDFLK